MRVVRERHNGVWGGCWCMAFHAEGVGTHRSFLHNATVLMFERHGFERTRPLGKHHWLMTKVVRRASKSAAQA
jgi:hypothetical protein